MVVTSRVAEIEALAEDFLTAWVPDPAGLVDIAAQSSGAVDPPRPVVRWLSVPRPDNRSMRVPVLHPAAHAALHRAVEPVRDYVDQVLSPGVCGYRRGAESGDGYRAEFLRFADLVTEGAAHSSTVVFADVKQFFDSVSLTRAADVVARLVGPSEAQELRALAEEWADSGLVNLPAGYADARMLANLILHEAEASFAYSFARWVDDYRVFVQAGQSEQVILADLDRRLSGVGLVLNRPKTRVIQGDIAALESRNSLASVYHPERDPVELVRKKLRAVWVKASRDPVGSRRALRFALPRLASVGDPIAIDYALKALSATPWEAPRLIAYLHAFEAEPTVAAAAGCILASAARGRDAWLLCRLAPLACRLEVTHTTAASLEAALPTLVGSPAWGSVLRILSVHGYEEIVSAHAGPFASDPRTAIVALNDIAHPIPPELAAIEPATAASLGTVAASLPPIDSLL